MRRYQIGGSILTLGALLVAGPTIAHHSFSAEFDATQRIEVVGHVTNVQWTNPHVWVWLDVEDEETGEVHNWGFEMGPPHGLQRRGWRRDTLQIGEEVQVEGSLARDGSRRINASQVIVTSTGSAPLDPASSEGVIP